jgi:hypothetical protein
MPVRRLWLFPAFAVVALISPDTVLAQSSDCTRNANQVQWFVRAGAASGGDGTNQRPVASLGEIERCAPAGATITVLAPPDGATPLDGGIRLKDRQKLIGVAPGVGGKPLARCELYDIAGQGKPSGIDARFHLTSDPRPPK